MFKAKQSCREGNLSEEEEGRGKKPPNSVYIMGKHLQVYRTEKSYAKKRKSFVSKES
jgi:hypothetical protein